MLKIIENEKVNGIELYFNGKPSSAIIEQLKAYKFRWHNVKKCWYNKATDESKNFAQSLNGEKMATSAPLVNSATTKKSLYERIKDALKEIDNTQAGTIERDTKELAKASKSFLNKFFPECKISASSGWSGYTRKIDIIIYQSPYKKDYYNKYHFQGIGKTAEVNIPSLILDIAKNYTHKVGSYYDNSDPYTDYFEVAFYDDYKIQGIKATNWQYIQTEPTDEQKEDIKDFNEQMAKAYEEEQARQHQEYLKQVELDKIAQLEYQKEQEKRAETAQKINDFVVIEDLPEDKQIAVCGLVQGWGKENSLKEVNKNIRETLEKGEALTVRDCIISRKIHFNAITDSEKMLFNEFSKMFLYDFDFLKGKGGTDTEDIRVNDDNYYKLKSEQLKSVSFFDVDCVGVYLNNVLQYVINPEGYNYARYILTLPEIFDEQESSISAVKYREINKQLSENKKAFYIPEKVIEQTAKADIKAGDVITVVNVDGWLIIASETSGTVESVEIKDYAQYKDCLKLSIVPTGKRKTVDFWVKDGGETAIFKGELPPIPNSLKYRNFSDELQENLYSGMNAKSYIVNVIEYMKKKDIYPIIDTIQR